MAKEYKDTLNLPVTEYSMRANLTQKEPETLGHWDEIGLYELMLKNNEGNREFILHDGPPFSNGNIHIGHALNKLLKDFIVKSKSMQGYYTPYVPGWDNHGMPIESAIIKKNKLDRKRMTIPEFRKNCEEFAQNFIDLQRTSFKRLGVVGDWEHPYTTMAPSFEAKEIRVFGEMYRKGYIYKGLKPVYWCAHDETALAEAEIEYADIKCTSIYVKFKVKEDKGLLADVCDLNNTYFIIWTTTPWTLPGNMAIALHPRETYVLVKAGKEYYILAEALCDKTMKFGGITEYETVKTFIGSDFEYCKAYHPFLDKDSLLVTADYVTMDSGTGCVHTAPGFGVDDYHTGVRYGLDICVPVDDRGRQTELAGKYAGMTTDESNGLIVEDMRADGSLFASEDIIHSYPHCWRCKNPIIFRATPQWFCSVEKFRDAAVKACEGVEWLPAWGGDRISSMVRERADWCISRQRHWGLPIPVFYCEDCGEVICTPETIDSVANVFAAEGSNAWFTKDASDLLPKGFVCPKCGKTHFVKETDTLDGWFDSGSTHYDVLGDDKVADLYLEGADQYRGWFQSSLLTAVGATKGKAPFKQVLTHGWTVDGEGKAMHKSLGNTVAPEDVIKQYGADMLRLWVASSDYRVDVRVSDAIFKQLSESYRKIRNTIRILLANVGDYDPDKDAVAVDKMSPIDQWALACLGKLCKTCVKAYNDYEFHVVYHEVLSFCTIELSKWYIDMTKDTLYCEKQDAVARRAVQTVMYEALSAIIRLMAPILSYTAEEAWSFIKHKSGDKQESVFLNKLPEYDTASLEALVAEYDKLFTCRDDVMKALEVARADKLIGKSLEADVTIYGDNEAMDLFERHKDQLETIMIVSHVHLDRGAAPADAFADTACGVKVKVALAQGEKCVRCWAYRDETYDDGEGGKLCKRCHDAIC